MTYREFLKKITSDQKYLGDHGIAYATYHARRFYFTYNYCIKYLNKGSKVLSVGAGSGSVEKMLVAFGADVTVVDFKGGIDANQAYYDLLGIKTCAANLLTDSLDLPMNYFDLLLCSEIIEHIPMAPQQQLQNISQHLRTGASVIITTPNLGSIMHIIRLLFMKPILEVPEKTFGPVNAENQATHRREYLPAEIREAFRKGGFRPVLTRYFFYTYKKTLSAAFLFVFGSLIPRFRPGMLLAGEKTT